MKSIVIILGFVFFSHLAFGAQVLKVGKTKVLISNDGATFKKGDVLKVRSKNKKLVAKLKVLKTSKQKTLAIVLKKSKTRKMAKV